MGQMRGWIVVFAAMPVIGLLIYAWSAGPKHTEEQKVAQAIARDEIASDYAPLLQEIAERFVVDSGRPLNTRAPPDSKHINVFLLKRGSGAARSLSCNCAYIGDAVVLCDQAFLETFSKALNHKATDPRIDALLGRVDAYFARFLMSWLIGHEIGHALLHDKDGGLMRAARRSGFALSEKQEVEADEFFLEHIDAKEIVRAHSAMMEFLFQATLAAFRFEGGTSQAVFRPSADGVHPPWISRALHLEKLLTDRDSSRLGKLGFYKGIAPLISIAPSGIDLGSFCAAENLRQNQTPADADKLARAIYGTPSAPPKR
jgi:hypothetical protein